MRRPVRPPTGAGTAGARIPPRTERRPGRPSKTHRRPYDIESVTDAAVRVFNRRGYEAASMEDVARETGLTKSSLYYHVSGKEELLARALERAFGRLLGILEEPGAKAGTPLERLKHIVRRAVIITLEFVQEVELLQRIKGNTPTERQAMERRRSFDREVAALVAQAAEAGEIRSDIDVGLLTRLVFGMSNSTTQWYKPAGRFDVEQIADRVCAVVFEGIERRPR
jgi:AcrR family transcriptional regulator